MKETWSFDQQQQQRKFLKRFKIKEWVGNSYCNSDRTWKNKKNWHTPSFKVSIASQSIFRQLDCYLDHLFGHLFVSIFYMNLFSGRLDSYLDQADRHDIVANMGSQYRKRKVGVINTVKKTSWDFGTCICTHILGSASCISWDSRKETF